MNDINTSTRTQQKAGWYGFKGSTHAHYFAYDIHPHVKKSYCNLAAFDAVLEPVENRPVCPHCQVKHLRQANLINKRQVSHTRWIFEIGGLSHIIFLDGLITEFETICGIKYSSPSNPTNSKILTCPICIELSKGLRK